MRWLLLCAAFCTFPVAAATTTPRQEWEAFRENALLYAGGPRGLYAIQHMIELDPGETAFLPATGSVYDLRWSKTPVAHPVARVEHGRDGKVMIDGIGIATTDLTQAPDRALELPNGLLARVTPLGPTTLKLWLVNPRLPALRRFKGLSHYPFDPRGVIVGTFHRDEAPKPVSYLDSRDRAGVMYVVGTLDVDIGGKAHTLKAYSYVSDWAAIEGILLLLKDETSGRTTYGGGRVAQVEFPRGAPPRRMRVNLNTLYSFLCAHSEYFNCPLMLTDRVAAALPYGERHAPP